MNARAVSVTLVSVAAIGLAAPPASADVGDRLQRGIVRELMIDVLRDDAGLRSYTCGLYSWNRPAAYRVLWRSKVSSIPQYIVRRGTRDAVDRVCR